MAVALFSNFVSRCGECVEIYADSSALPVHHEYIFETNQLYEDYQLFAFVSSIVRCSCM